MGSALIEKNVHLLVLDGVLEVAEEIFLQVIREVGREEKEGVLYRRCIQILKEGEEERDSIFLSSSSISCTLRSSLLPEFIDQHERAIAQRFADPCDAREVLREGGVAVHHTILYPQSIPYDSRAVNLVWILIITLSTHANMEKRPSVASSAGTKQPIWFMYTMSATCFR